MRGRMPRRIKRKQFGYIYFMKSDSFKGYKIGKTTDWKERIHAVSVKMPINFEYEYVFEVRDITYGENLFHKEFADKRMTGEWFDLDEDDLRYAENIFVEYEHCVIYAPTRRIPDRPIKVEDFKRQTKAERFPIKTCPVCTKQFRRVKKNYVCCSIECYRKYNSDSFWEAFPDWVYTQAGGVPAWARFDGIAPSLNYWRDPDDLQWEYYRLCDRDG